MRFGCLPRVVAAIAMVAGAVWLSGRTSGFLDFLIWSGTVVLVLALGGFRYRAERSSPLATIETTYALTGRSEAIVVPANLPPAGVVAAVMARSGPDEDNPLYERARQRHEQGGPQATAETLELLRMAAGEGIPAAKTAVGLVMVKDDSEFTAGWNLIREAADSGYPYAMVAMATLALHDGSQWSYLDWLRRAAAAGEQLAVLMLHKHGIHSPE